MLTSRCSSPEYGTTMVSSPCSFGVSSVPVGASAAEGSLPGSCPLGAAASSPGAWTTARTGWPPVPFFLRHSSWSQPSRLVASQPSPTAAPIVSLLPPLKDAGALLPAFVGGVGAGAAAAAASGGAELDISPDVAVSAMRLVAAGAGAGAGSDLLQPTTPRTNQIPKFLIVAAR